MVSRIILLSIFIFFNHAVDLFAGSNSVNFFATELLGRPTDKSVTVNAVADAELTLFLRYGLAQSSSGRRGQLKNPERSRRESAKNQTDQRKP